MKILDSKRIAFALFLLPGVGAFAQTSTQGLLAVVGAAGPTLASDLVNAATGALSQAQVINEAQVVGGAFTHVTAHPTGRFVYAVGLFINGYTIDAGDGALTPVAGSPYLVPASAQSGGVAVEASGRFLYVGVGVGVLGYTIDPATGALTSAIAGSPFAVRSGEAVALVSDGAGKYLYAAGANGGVSVLAIDATTGALTEIAGSPFGSGSTVNGLAMDPQKRFLFVSGTNGIAGYAINGTTGGLTPLAGSPFFPGVQTDGVSFDGSGRFLYALQTSTSSLWGLAVDGTSGNLNSCRETRTCVELVISHASE